MQQRPSWFRPGWPAAALALAGVLTALSVPAQEASLDVAEALGRAARAQAAAGEAQAEARALIDEAQPLPDRTTAIPLAQAPTGPSDDDLLITGSIPLSTRAEPPATSQQHLALAPDDERADPRTPSPSVPGVAAADLATMRRALEHYRKGQINEGDAAAAEAADPTARAALEWAVIRLHRQKAGFGRIARFSAANPALPMADWVRSRAEDALFLERFAAESVLAFFATQPPRTGNGKMALARAKVTLGQHGEALALVRDSFRNDGASTALRSVIDKDFPGAITPADRRYLAERLAYDGHSAAALTVAQAAGPTITQLIQLLNASLNESASAPALLARLDPALAKEPAVILARTQHLRRSGKMAEAGQMLLSAPDDADRIVDGVEWWTERRMMARKLLDLGDATTAYRIVAAHHAESPASRVDAEVHAGWLALRFLNDFTTAYRHFESARSAAMTPASLARAEYWRGRAAEAMGDPAADWAYLAASGHRHTYHGQLAAARLGEAHLPALTARPSPEELEAATTTPGLRVIRALLDADARDLAQPLIADAARSARRLEEAVALGDLVARHGLARMTIQTGKLAMQQGLKVEDHAFPVFGVPAFEPVADSAELAIVYAIARQESELDPAALSHAGARGLMQLMPATARRTADRFKIPLDIHDLTRNPALNARIGAAHLGELFGEYNGNYLLSFAAYNAGGGRVKEWVAAYGDPRDPQIDPIDWIERIPITETRHYVQKILENLQIYRARLTGSRNLGIAADLARGARKGREGREGARRIAVSVPPPAPPVIR